MSKTFEVWLDSGANIHSNRKQIITLEELSISDEEWNEMSDEEKEDLMKDIAFDRCSWGYIEIES